MNALAKFHYTTEPATVLGYCSAQNGHPLGYPLPNLNLLALSVSFVGWQRSAVSQRNL